MQAGDIIQMFRILMTEPYKTRWSDSDALVLASQAQRDVARETRALEGRVGIAVESGIQEYPFGAMGEIIGAIKRVYMVGPGFCQRLPKTSIPQMEGEQLRIYDQSGANLSPQWAVLPAQPYPVANCQIGPGYTALPMFPGTRPEYYLRGQGVIGIVPAPLGTYTLVLDIMMLPPEMTDLKVISPFTPEWKMTMAWYMCKLAYFADQSVGAQSLMDTADKEYQTELAKQQSAVSNFDEDDPQGPIVMTHRLFYGTGGVPLAGGID